MRIVVGVKGTDAQPIKSDGTTPANVDNQEGLAAGATLVASTTYFYVVPAIYPAALQSYHVKWDSAAVLTVTLEKTNFQDYTNYSTTTGEWTEEDSTTDLTIDKTSGTVTGTSLAVAGGTAGSSTFTWKFASALRTRLKIVVGTTGGVVRVAAVGKDL